MNTSKNHIDFKFFRDYYTNKLSAEERSNFEKVLENDPFAKEAFEGFLLLENDFDRISLIENSNMDLKKKLGLETKTSMFSLKPILAIAASLVLLIGSYFIIQLNSETQTGLAENKLNATEEIAQKSIKEITKEKDIVVNEATIVMDSEDIEQNIVTEEELEDDIISNKVSLVKENKKKTIVKQERKKQISNEDFDLYRKQNEVEAEKTTPFKNDKSVSEVTLTAAKENRNTEPISPSSSNTVYFNDSEIEEPKSLNELTEYKKGIVAYNQSEYSKAIKYFNNSLANNKSVNSSNYFLAMTYFNQNKPTKSIKYFDKVINSSSSYKDKAKWYKSLSLINKSKRSEAIILLSEIANSNSTFKNSAKEKLKDL